MQTIKASEFKARCLKLMDEIQKSGEEIVITKNGHPVSKLVPFHVKAATLLGLHKGVLEIPDGEVFSADETWNAEQ